MSTLGRTNLNCQNSCSSLMRVLRCHTKRYQSFLWNLNDKDLKAMDQGASKKPFLINFLATLQHETLTDEPPINDSFHCGQQKVIMRSPLPEASPGPWP